ncbi:MAG: CpXC domain-containing protein [Georgfuchsia sp.]
MSKKVAAEIMCPKCGEKFRVNLIRLLWAEFPENRKLISTDSINAVVCPNCETRTRLEFPFLCTNIKKGIAIWYEPYHDPAIDQDQKLYASKFGDNSFYANAPRVQDWEVFKVKLAEMERLAISDEDVPLNVEHKPRYANIVIEPFTPYRSKISNGESNDWLFNRKKRGFLSLRPFHVTFLTKQVPWRKRDKLFKHFIFFSGCWALGTVFLVFLFDPFDYGSSFGKEELLHLLGVSVGLPLFFAVATYLYKKFIA